MEKLQIVEEILNFAWEPLVQNNFTKTAVINKEIQSYHWLKSLLNYKKNYK